MGAITPNNIVEKMLIKKENWTKVALYPEVLRNKKQIETNWPKSSDYGISVKCLIAVRELMHP